MRNETEMMNLIMNIALHDDRIRAVYMNGSRTNPNVPKDIFQDYDIVYVVTETKPFYEEEHWTECFGEILLMQMPEKMDYMRGIKSNFDDTYGWLMLFTDGNRIDLHVNAIKYAQKEIRNDKLCKILLDKDGVMPKMPPATEEDYYVRKLSENEFLCDCNNYWWCLNNVAKGLWRKEVPYVMDMIHNVLRPILIRLLGWKIEIQEQFACSIGKSGKYLYQYLSTDRWEAFLRTYPDAKIEHIWDSVDEMCNLFDLVAKEVAEALNYTYNEKEEKAARAYFNRVHKLPGDCKEIW